MSANDQQNSYNCSPREPLTIGQQILLQDPTAQKLGPSIMTKIKSPLTIVIKKGDTTKVVHVSRIHPLVGVKDTSDDQIAAWSPLYFEHLDGEDSPNAPAGLQSGGNTAVPPTPVVTRS